MTTRRTPAGTDQTPAATATTRRATRSRRGASAAPVDTEEPRPAGQAFVLDTSVLLADPAAFLRFAEHEVVLPLVVISELEGKRHHPELGWFARQALRMLDELRVQHGRLDRPVPVNDAGGTLRVELNHADDGVLPPGFRTDSNDARILSVALGLAAEGQEVTLVTKDMPLRVKAAAVGLRRGRVPARPGQRPDLDRAWPSWSSPRSRSAGCTPARRWTSDAAAELPCHTGLVLHSAQRLGARPGAARTRPCGWSAATGRRSGCAAARPSSGSRWTCCWTSRSGIVSLGGRAGTGKSALALCAGLEAVMERRKHRKVVVFRPLYAVGGQELGYLPGSRGGEDVAVGAGGLRHARRGGARERAWRRSPRAGMLEVLPLTHIRGRSLHDAFVIVDEAQSLERGVLLTVLSRIGQGSRVVLTHDVAQRDNLRVGRHDGVAAVIEALKGHPLFAHVTLTRSERSPIAAMVTDLLEDIPQ